MEPASGRVGPGILRSHSVLNAKDTKRPSKSPWLVARPAGKITVQADEGWCRGAT